MNQEYSKEALAHISLLENRIIELLKENEGLQKDILNIQKESQNDQ